MKKKLIFSIIAICISFLIAVGTTVAWFAGGQKMNGNILYVSNPNSILANVYIGNDSNYDGILDSNEDSLIRESVVKNEYTEAIKNVSADNQNLFENMNVGYKITYKIIIINKKDNKSAQNISVNFSNLSGYFYENINEDYITLGRLPAEGDASFEEFNDLLGTNSAMVLYSIENLRVRIYKGSDEENGDFTHGYNNLVKSSDDSDGVEKIKNINAMNLNSLYLWQISSEQSFIENIAIGTNELMEIDFCLQYNSIMDLVTPYKEYVNNNYVSEAEEIFREYYQNKSIEKSDEEITQIAAQYVSDMSDSEISYFFPDTEESLMNQKLDLEIKRINIYSINKGEN